MAYFAQSQLNAAGNIHHTPQGLMYLAEWGPLRYAAGGAGIMAMYARSLNGQPASNGIAPEEIFAFAEHQVCASLQPERYIPSYCRFWENPKNVIILGYFLVCQTQQFVQLFHILCATMKFCLLGSTHNNLPVYNAIQARKVVLVCCSWHTFWVPPVTPM